MYYYGNMNQDLRTRVGILKVKMLNGMSYEDAQKELQPYLDKANRRGEELAKEYGQKFKRLTFNYVIR